MHCIVFQIIRFVFRIKKRYFFTLNVNYRQLGNRVEASVYCSVECGVGSVEDALCTHKVGDGGL